MNSNNAQSKSGPSTAPSLRPRQKRLISGLEEGDETAFDPVNARPIRIPSPTPAPLDNRSASPVPLAHPHRLQGAKTYNALGRGGSLDRGASRKPANGPSPLAGLWGNSWTALQGLASDLLGNDISTPNTTTRSTGKPPLSRLGSDSAFVGTAAAQWGPRAPSGPKSGTIGAGTREEQAAAFRAQKRKDMLMGQDSSYADTLGKFKRRLSDERGSISAPPGDGEEREALVYLHPVQKHDTLAGITIRYNISANTLRQANRMWPNDTVQVRQTLILPVAACGIKGRPMSRYGGEQDLLGSESEALDTLMPEEVPSPAPGPAAPVKNGLGSVGLASLASTVAPSSIAGDGNITWQHDSWVMLPGSTTPTQIVRLSRRALGYFPPARRKSNSWSDGSPVTSLDLTRPSAPANGATASPPASRSPTQQRARVSSTDRPRRLSNSTSGYFPSFLAGPGGVGTMSKNVHSPGPAQDGLNKFFAKHLPDVAPPRNQSALYHPEVPVYTDEGSLPLGSGAATPAYPQGGGNLNLENVGGAIESWVRRLAAKATNPPVDSRKTAAGRGPPGKGPGGVGDLIEMTDEFEIGDDEEDGPRRERQSSSPERSRGRRPEAIPPVGANRANGSRTGTTSHSSAGLREQTRSRGAASSHTRKSGKAD